VEFLRRIINLGELELQQLITDSAQELSQRISTEEEGLRLLTRIKERNARIGVVGLGYVGLPLAIEWARAGFLVTGIDNNPLRVDMCLQSRSWIADVPSEDLGALVCEGQFTATTDISVFRELDVIIICVPTPLNETKQPDIGAILTVVDAIAISLHPGQLIVLESTTYPGTTDECILPRLQQSSLKVGEEFFLGYSPERIDPGNTHYGLRNTPKVIAGITSICIQMTKALYETVVDTVIPVSSTRAAELVKLFENTFRAVNIGLVNELAMMSNLLSVDVWEVISAAGTKPYGFTTFYPGPGIGGHCIPIDPHYLAWKMRTLNYESRLIEAACEINEQMPRYVVERISRVLRDAGKCLDASRVLVLGVAYKRDVGDLRESPAIEIIDLLREHKAEVDYVDPYIPVITLKNEVLTAVLFDEDRVRNADCVLILTNHSVFDYASIVRIASLVVDTRNATAGLGESYIMRL
jgi:UDP-N-acetyl-D-glucosamine dehydrogenase